MTGLHRSLSERQNARGAFPRSRLSCSFGADIRQLHDLLHTTQLWNMAQPDSFQQNEMNQVQRVSTTNTGPGVVVGETVNSDPAAWIRNAGSGDAANRLSQQVAVRSLFI